MIIKTKEINHKKKIITKMKEMKGVDCEKNWSWNKECIAEMKDMNYENERNEL